MIRIENLTVQFGGIRPLDDLNAELTASIVGLIGPNGAGKTTLLHVVSGFVTPVSGVVKLDDVDLLGLSPTRRVALGVRRTFQQEYVVDDLTLWENVLSVADHVSPGARSAREETARAIDFVGLDRRRHVQGRWANLFERRMTEIAKTLTGRPRVVLLDEPGAGLNEAEVDRLRQLLLAIPRAFDLQLIVIDHDADLIASVCEQTMVLDFGKRLALGPTRTVLDDPGVRRAYLGNA
jgi:branched-chain amino acid transport system ATP-binding protein